MAIVKRPSTPQATSKVEVKEIKPNQTQITTPTNTIRESDLESNTRCDLLYGPSGVGKTENLGLAAKYIWEKYGLITRLVSADGGGWKSIQPYIDLGIIKPYSIIGVKKHLGVMMAMTEGQWPKLKNGSLTLTPLETIDIEGDEKNGVPGVGGMCFEGLTSFADALFSYLTIRSDIQLPEQPKDCFVMEDGVKYSFAGRSNYQFVQTRIQEMVARTNGLPFKKMIWTALEDGGIDPETNEKCYGPKVVGKALTGKVPAWFGDCIHLVNVSDDERIDDGRTDFGKLVKGGIPVKRIRAYMANHPHKQTGQMYSAKGRTSAWVGKGMPPFFDVIINGDEQKGLNWVYEQEDLLGEKAAKLISASLTRPAPVEMYKVKGSVSVEIDLKENETDANISETDESNSEVEENTFKLSENENEKKEVE